MPGLTYHIENQVATIVLNNPPQNRIGDQMIDELAGAIDAIGGSDARALLEAVVMRTNSLSSRVQAQFRRDMARQHG